MAVKRVALGADNERIERGRVAFVEIGASQLGRRLVQLVDKFLVVRLPCRDAREQVIAGPVHQLSDQRHLYRESAGLRFDARGGEGAGYLGMRLHGSLSCVYSTRIGPN